MNQILAVCDSEIAYAYQMVNYLTNKKNFPFQVQLFTSNQTLSEYAIHHPIAVALISQKDYSENIKKLSIEQIKTYYKDKDILDVISSLKVKGYLKEENGKC